jgi:hypothetical protein
VFSLSNVAAVAMPVFSLCPTTGRYHKCRSALSLSYPLPTMTWDATVKDNLWHCGSFGWRRYAYIGTGYDDKEVVDGILLLSYNIVRATILVHSS